MMTKARLKKRMMMLMLSLLTQMCAITQNKRNSTKFLTLSLRLGALR
jgi:hypothetical protein